ncbi:hypothetical protein [Tenacibaculum sp. nBUS_03]|uniref:hypothetical protein n=1 Tax=Tenacibaculum sp. nBUS_03 TaxID=3395320 RepID=UPI003EB8C9BC
MKRTTILITILSIFLSCKKEHTKSNFLGNWSSTSDSNFNIDIQFFNDSTVVDNPLMIGTYSTRWKIVNKRIEQNMLRNNGQFAKEKSVLDFEFNSTKDTLLIKKQADSIYFKFRRIKNNFEYLENRIGLKLDLPMTNEPLTSYGNKDFVFNVYLGKKNDSVIIKTDNHLRRFGKLEHQVISFYSSKKEQEKDSLKFVVFTDRSLKDRDLDSIKTILKKLPIKKFFRIYKCQEYIKDNWKTEINWVGKYEN